MMPCGILLPLPGTVTDLTEGKKYIHGPVRTCRSTFTGALQLPACSPAFGSGLPAAAASPQ